MLDIKNILETVQMIQGERLDVRTITMGISLLDCADSDIDRSCEKVFDKITTKAKNLVSVGETVEKTYGIPIVNKRISITPIAILAGVSGGDPVKYAKTLQKAADAVGVNFIGGYSALVHKGFSAGDKELIASIPEALAETELVCSSINIGSTKSGINMDAIYMMSRVIKETAKKTADRQSIGCAKLVVFCNAPEDNPFMAGAFHGVGEPDCVINVGVSGPGVVAAALARAGKQASINEIADIIKKTAFKVTRMGQLVGEQASEMLGVPFGIVDLSLAPTPAEGDSVAEIIERMGVSRCGAPGTTACLALLNDAVKKGGVMASGRVGGLSGAFIPVSEDSGMMRAVREGALCLEKLEAMTSVCSVGLDMIIVPGKTTADTIAGLIADEAAIGMVNQKTTAVRIIPAEGYDVGDELNFGGLLGGGPIMPINGFAQEEFVARKGYIPAPIQSLKN